MKHASGQSEASCWRCCYIPSSSLQGVALRCAVSSLLVGESYADGSPALLGWRSDHLHHPTRCTSRGSKPNDLSNALWAAFKQRELYNLYISSLAGDTERAKGLLEVFDKVRSATTCTISWIGSQHRCAVQALQSTTYDVTIFEQFRQLCGRVGLLPASHMIPGRFIQMSEHPIARGEFWRCLGRHL
jgi:hypothetical protein